MRLKNALTVVASLLVLAAAFTYFFSTRPQIEIPNCLRLHAGNTYTDVRYDPAVLKPEIDKTTSFRLYRLVDTAPYPHNADAVYILAVREVTSRDPSDTVDSIIAIAGMDPGPVYNQKSALGGIPAALATPQPDYFYYKVPFGNRIIDIDYRPHQLTPTERQATDKMMADIQIHEAPMEQKSNAIIGPCYE